MNRNDNDEDDGNNEEKEPRSRRSVVTPSPNNNSSSSRSSRSSSRSRSSSNHNTGKGRPSAAVVSQTTAVHDVEIPNHRDDHNDNNPVASVPTKRPRGRRPAAAPPHCLRSDSRRPENLIRAPLSDQSNDNDDDNNDSAQEDRPFYIDYAPSSRSTCRRCDAVIDKGTLRVSHQPLFRGKPGFRVFRHLTCALFSPPVQAPRHVAGWRQLTPDDVARLAQRIHASRAELEWEQQELSPDELIPVVFAGETRAPPPGVTVTLLPFQTEGVSWMYHQEVHVPKLRGGLLADEMGMGKTLQTIVTILDHRPLLQHCAPGAKHPPMAPDRDRREREASLWDTAVTEWKHEMAMNRIPTNKIHPKHGHGPARAGTLVICPVIALSQWKSEIEKFTAPGTLSVAVYHGADRASELPPDVLQKYDVILTTYQVLEQDFRKMVSPNKVACPNCGSKFKLDKLRVHLKYFCGDGAQRTEAQARQRRTADRPGRRGGSGSGSKGKSKKPPLTKVTSASTPHSASSKRKTIRVKKRTSEDYDSDSELSVVEDEMMVVVAAAAASTNKNGGTKRPSRLAAVTASKKLTASVQQWGSATQATTRKRKQANASSEDEEASIANDGDGSSESEACVPESENDDADNDDAGSDGESDGSEDVPLTQLAPPKRGKVVQKPHQPTKKTTSAASALERAIEKQRNALEDAKSKSKKGLGNKKMATKKKGQKEFKKKHPSPPPKKKQRGKGNGGKGDPSDSSGDEESDGSAGNDDDDDPMAGIDMQELMKQAMAGSRVSPLHSFCWWRVVLDEAHFIKSRSSQTAAAAFALTSVHRWCLSGTPLQNRVGELYSLIRFLRIDPMAYYFCRQKGCTCKSIHYRFENGRCLDCDHRPFCHYAHFNRHVLNPIQRDGYSGDGRRAMFKLKQEVLDMCLLRRTKETRAEDMSLPPRIVTIRSVRLHPVEEDFYQALYTQTKSSFNDYVAQGTLLNNYAHIFDLLTKMRQAVDHPYLIVYSNRNMTKINGQQQSMPAVANGSVDCDMCHEPPTDRVVSSCCGAGFCRGCVLEYLTGAVGENTPCPSCEAPFTIDLNQASCDDTVDDATLTVTPGSSNANAEDRTAMPSLKELPHVATGSILRRINLAEFATSTKIEVLVQELVEMRQKRPGSKALVFSQFVNMLDLVRWRLHSDPCLADLGLGVRILHGGMDVKSRDAALRDFREDKDCRVLLMSLKAAGVALNLTVASECFILDLWWNPAAEMQAIDRTHRLGQYRPIRAVRFVAEGTVEERVLQLQEKKRLVFDGTIGRDAGSLKMLTVDDMVSLFA